MRTISHPLFIVLAVAYFTYFVLKHFLISLPETVTSYFADLVSLFLINTFILFVMRKRFRNPEFELPISMVTLSLILISVVFEVVQPAISKNYVADPIDIVCYAISAISYIFWRRNWKLF